MAVKMIVTDLDGTLLRSDKTITGYTARVLRLVRERGVLTAFATARDFRFVTEHISPLFDIVPDIVIADNGALARYNGNDIYKRLIPAETANALISKFESVRCLSTETAYFLAGEYSEGHWSVGKRDTVITDFSDAVTDGVLYLDGNAGSAASAITAGFHEVRPVIYSDISLVALVHREASKLSAVTAAEKILNITENEILFFGDDYSDIDLLAHCANSVATANAIDEAKAAAAHICGDCDSDGVAKWLEEHLL